MKKNKLATWVIVLITALAMVGFSGLFNLGPSRSPSNSNSPGDNGTPANNTTIKSVPCLTSEIFHIHPHLQILVDPSADSTGSPQAGPRQAVEELVPANIGILPGCTRELHTHATDGIIHIEAAVDRGYVFADFLSVWGKPLLRDGYTLKITVDGKETTNPNFVMKDNQQIVLEYTRI